MNDFYVADKGGRLLCSISTEHKLGDKTLIEEAVCGEFATYEQICSCGRSKLSQSDKTPHTFSDDGVCTN